jgi:hypothetical protein
MSFHDFEIVTRFSCDIFCCLLHNFLMRFPYENVCNLKNVCLLWAVTVYFDQGTSAFFSCALTVNVIGLLFLRQCFPRLSLSTETSISGTLPKLPR